MKLTKSTEEVYHWLDDNPQEKDCLTLYAAFPDRNKSSLRAIKSKHKKLNKEEKWPENKQIQEPNESINKSIDTCIQSELVKGSEKSKNISEMNDNHQASNETINESKNTFIDLLFDKKDMLLTLLSDYEEQGAISLTKEIEIVKPFKGVSFLLMEKTVNEFAKVCKSQKISQRKAVHIALNDFIKNYKI
jgi:hypothetical protein